MIPDAARYWNRRVRAVRVLSSIIFNDAGQITFEVHWLSLDTRWLFIHELPLNGFFSLLPGLTNVIFVDNCGFSVDNSAGIVYRTYRVLWKSPVKVGADLLIACG
jgi:hypothetical protein